jgi:glycosyltransferase involved in cell wall biosynthesis
LKNTLGVVRTAAVLRRTIPGVRFRIAGPWQRNNPACQQTVEQFCKAEKLDDTVTFLGPLSRQAILNELAGAACLFLPSFQENAPMVIAEAMAAGLPVAASNVGGIPWMVTHGKTGLLFDPHRLDDMVECLRRMLVDPAFCGTLGQAAFQEASDRYRADRVAERTLAVYDEAIADQDPKSLRS